MLLSQQRKNAAEGLRFLLRWSGVAGHGDVCPVLDCGGRAVGGSGSPGLRATGKAGAAWCLSPCGGAGGGGGLQERFRPPCWTGEPESAAVLSCAGKDLPKCGQQLIALHCVHEATSKVASCFASLLTDGGWRRVTKLVRGCPVVGGERLSEVALLDLQGRRLRRNPGDSLQRGLAEKVQPGSSFSQDEHGVEEKSFHDGLELSRPVLCWKGAVPITPVTFRRN